MNLEAYRAVDLRLGVEQGQAVEAFCKGAVLFADLAGFSTLMEDAKRAFNQEDGVERAGEMRGQKRAADFISRKLYEVYLAFVAEVHRYRGVVIGFSGDGMLCWFAGDTGARAIVCAFGIQAIMQEDRFVEFDITEEVKGSLGVKVAVVAGEAQRFVVGDPDILRMDMLVGEPVDEVAEAEGEAKRGEVIITPKLAKDFASQLEKGEERSNEDTKNPYVVVRPNPAAYSSWLASVQSETEPWDVASIRSDGLAEQWVAPAVLERLHKIKEDYFADLRSTVPLFLKMEGVSFETAQDIRDFDVYIRAVQKRIHDQGGTVLQLTTGDKGIYLYASFGAPVAYDDNVVRACEAALQIRDFTKDMETATVESVKIGLNEGFMWAGNYGSPNRMTYGVLGTAVNMAARLMMVAEPNAIVVNSALVSSANHLFSFLDLEEVMLKGQLELQSIHELEKRVPILQNPAGTYQHPLVGRDKELALLHTRLDLARSGRGQTIRLTGPPGIGKSHLSAVFIKQAQEKGCQTRVGVCHRIASGDSYAAWRPVLRTLLGLDVSVPAGEEINEIAHITDLLTKRNPDWTDSLPLLDTILGLQIPINQYVNGLKLQEELTRKPRLEPARTRLITDILLSFAAENPLLTLLEDIHWVDEASLQLLTHLTQTNLPQPICVLTTHRPHDNEAYTPLDTFAENTPEPILVDNLQSDEVETILIQTLGQPINPLILDLMLYRANGNPFYTEQLVLSLKENERFISTNGIWELSDGFIDILVKEDCLTKEDGQWVWQDKGRLNALPLIIPTTVNAAVQMRLDYIKRQLPAPETIEVASVVGGEPEATFFYDLLGEEYTESDINTAFTELVKGRFVLLVADHPTPKYRFRHHIIQEVAYEALTDVTSQTLHEQTALWYEQTYDMGKFDLSSSPSFDQVPFLALLVHHWEFAKNEERERIYAGLAGEQAINSYMNRKAVQLLSRSLKLIPTENLNERFHIFKLREEVYDWMGKRDKQWVDLAVATSLAQTPQEYADIYIRWAMYTTYTNNYQASLELAQRALAYAQSANNSERQEALAYEKWGRALNRARKHDVALEKFAEARQIYESLGAHLDVGRMAFAQGNTYYQMNKYDEATSFLAQAREYYEEFAYKRGHIQCDVTLASIADERSNFSTAISHYESAIKLCRETNWQPAHAITLDNLANTYHWLGHFTQAEQHYEQSHKLYLTVQDKLGQSQNIQALGLIAYFRGDLVTAEGQLKQALNMQQEIEDATYYEGHSWLYLGFVFEELGDYAKALTHYQKAEQIFRDPPKNRLTDALAGLASVYWKQGDRKAAHRCVKEMVGRVDQLKWDGIDYPGRVCLVSYQILNELAEEEAQRILKKGKKWLDETANKIEDDSLRSHFLQSIPFNRELNAL